MPKRVNYIFFNFHFQVILILDILEAAARYNSESLKALEEVAVFAIVISMTPLIWAAFAYEYYVLKTRIPNNQNQNLIHQAQNLIYQARDEGYEEI